MDSKIAALKPYKIGVLAGGPSSEREISLKSGNAVFRALQEEGLNTTFIDVKEDDFSELIDDADIDVAFMALHGRFGEDGIVQKMLEEKHIPYTGSGPTSSHLALDKIASKERFEAKSLHVPPYKVVTKDEDLSHFNITFPCVVKPRYEGSSIGLSIVPSKDYLKEALTLASNFSRDIIVEEFIHGREITVGILNDKPLPIIEIVPENGVYDFNAKYHSANTRYIVPAELDINDYNEVQRVGLEAHKALGCKDFSRVDLRLSREGRIFVLEVNTIPGLTQRSLLPMAAKAAGLSFFQLCVKMLYNALSLGRHCGEKRII